MEFYKKDRENLMVLGDKIKKCRKKGYDVSELVTDYENMKEQLSSKKKKASNAVLRIFLFLYTITIFSSWVIYRENRIEELYSTGLSYAENHDFAMDVDSLEELENLSERKVAKLKKEVDKKREAYIKARLEAGDRHFKGKRYEEALSEYEIGQIVCKSEEKKEEIKIRINETKLLGYIDAGNIHFNKKEYSAALSNYESAKTLCKDDQRSAELAFKVSETKDILISEYLVEGNSYLEGKEYNQAINSYEKAKSLGSAKATDLLVPVKKRRDLLSAAKVKYESGSFKKAMTLFKEYISKYGSVDSVVDWIKKTEKEIKITPAYIPSGLTYMRKNAEGMHEYTNQKDGSILIWIPAGSFSMGSDSEYASKPVHIIYLDGYFISKYEITFEQYDRFCDATGRKKPDDHSWGRGKRPVINVSWNDAVAYCKWAGLSLPTEAQWEKPSRGGENYKYSGSDYLYSVGWYGGNSGMQAHSVGKKKANGYGLYDMSGNVYEWCNDWYDKSYYSSSPKNDPKGPSVGSFRVARGGGWVSNSRDCGCAFRYAHSPSFSYNLLGFRPVKNLE